MNNSSKILIAPSTFASNDPTPLSKLESKGYEILRNPFGRKLSKAELIELLPNVTGIIAGLETLDREVLSKSTLKVISRCGSGISNVDLVAAKELKIEVRYTPDGPVEAVAELTIGSMLALLRNIPQANADLHQRKWLKIMGGQLSGKTILIIGYGRIGSRVAELLKPFDVQILAVDPHYDGNREGVLKVNLKDGLQKADIVTIHGSGEEEILGKTEFASMKKGVCLLNAARGGLINETELINALQKEIVSSAWLDVFETEPYTGPLTQYPQVILTPHLGSYTRECRQKMEDEAVFNLLDVLENQ